MTQVVGVKARDALGEGGKTDINKGSSIAIIVAMYPTLLSAQFLDVDSWTELLLAKKH